MRLLLDQGLPRTTAPHLQSFGIEAVHVGDLGLAGGSDTTILDAARQQERIVVTLDADFHALLVLTGAIGPSVIRIRIEGLQAKALARLLADVLNVCNDELVSGAMVSVTDSGVRVKRLPLLR